MFRQKRKRQDESGFRTRLEEVQHEVAARAEFWDKTSVAMFLGMVAMAGLLVFVVGLASLNQGEMTIPLLRSSGFDGWQFTLFCLNMMACGIPFRLPLPLMYFLKPRVVVIVFSALMLLNFVVFSYTFVLKIIGELAKQPASVNSPYNAEILVPNSFRP